MNESFEQAARYLAPSNDAFWHWTEDGSALVWHDGTTIAFRQEIEAVIDRLAPGGLPRFGAVVLLLAATRDKWESSAGRRTLGGMARGLQHLQTNVEASPGVKGAQVAFAVAARRVQEVLDRLDAVGRLPEEVRHGKLAKGVLAETVFEPAGKSLDAQLSLKICRAIAEGLPAEALAPRVPTEDPLGRFSADAGALQPGIDRIDAESLLLRARTGLDETPSPADFEPPNSDQMRRLLNSLRTDTELAGLARVAQNLMAAAHVPRALHAREELPVGGVSDLSNRGSLDRLLVSELANDPLTLAIRVALNEALYLRRESPPRDPPRRRALLLDCGIRTWGVPRAFGIAAALAFSATADPRSALSAYRATATGAEPINLGARAGLIECMAALEASPHPAAALRPFLDAIADGPDAPSEAILITHPDVLADAEFSASLAGLSGSPTFIATVDRDGEFQLFSYCGAGRRLLAQAKLDLRALFTQPRPATPLIATPNRTTLPAIFAADPFPLLLPCTIKRANALVSEQFGLVGVSGDGRLLQWASSTKYARQLTATLPPGRPVGLFDERSDPPMIRAAYTQHRLGIVHVLRVGLEEGKPLVERLQLDVPKPNACCMVGSLLCVISTDAVRAFANGSIRCVATIALPDGLIWRAGRFFSERRGDWFALAFDGQQLRFEKVPIANAYFVTWMFDREGLDGPWAVNFDGSVQAAGASRSSFRRLSRERFGKPAHLATAIAWWVRRRRVSLAWTFARKRAGPEPTCPATGLARSCLRKSCGATVMPAWRPSEFRPSSSTARANSV